MSFIIYSLLCCYGNTSIKQFRYLGNNIGAKILRFLPKLSKSFPTNMTEVHNQTLTESLYDDLEIYHSCSDDSEKLFAQTIGCIEEIVMREDFLKLRTNFLEKYWHEFDDIEENKLIYTDIFKIYIEEIEKYIEQELRKAIQEFDMHHFETILKNRQNELDGEIFEMLSTFTDFTAFKTMFLDYKAMKEGKTADFSQDFSISRCSFETEFTS